MQISEYSGTQKLTLTEFAESQDFCDIRALRLFKELFPNINCQQKLELHPKDIICAGGPDGALVLHSSQKIDDEANALELTVTNTVYVKRIEQSNAGRRQIEYKVEVKNDSGIKDIFGGVVNYKKNDEIKTNHKALYTSDSKESAVSKVVYIGAKKDENEKANPLTETKYR